MGMVKFATLEIKDRNPLDAASQWNIRTAQNKQVQKCKPGHRYYVVGGLHGDKPNGNGDYFSWDGELHRLLNGRAVYASNEIESHFPQPSYMYETWRGRGNYLNHNSTPRDWSNHNRVGTIIDVYPNIQEKSVDFLLEVDEQRAPWLVKAIDEGKVTDTSMGTYVEYSICSCCGNLATDIEGWCSCLKERKGKACIKGSSCTGRCAEHGGMVFEDNKDCTGLEDSWIIHGHGADPDAKHKYTIAEENQMAGFKSVSRASGNGDVGSSSVSDAELAVAIREAKAKRNDGEINQSVTTIRDEDQMVRMAQALGPDKLREMGYDPVAFGLSTVEEENIRIAEEAGKAGEDNNMTVDQIKEAIRQVMAETTVPSASMESGTGSEGYKPNPNSESMVKPEQFGRAHSVTMPVTTQDMGRVKSNEVAVPSVSMESGTGDEGYKANSNPESMVGPEQFGRDHSVTIPMTTAQLQSIIQASLQAFAQSATIPSASMESGTGSITDKNNIDEDPLKLVAPEKPNSPHSIDAIVDDRGNDAVDVAVPTSSTKSNESGDKSYVPNTSPENMVRPEKWGRPHPEAKPAVEAAKKTKKKTVKKDMKCQFGTKDNPFPYGKPPKNRPNRGLVPVEASFIEHQDPNYSMWEVSSDDGVMMRVAAIDAYPHETEQNYDYFSSENYGNALLDAIDTHGTVRVAREIGAQMSPTQPAGGAGAGMPPSMGDVGGGSLPPPEGGGAPVPAMDGGAPVNPNPEKSADIRDESTDEDGLSVEDTLVGVIAVMINDGEATIDEIRKVLDGFKEPQTLENFMGRVEQERVKDEEAKNDVDEAMGAGEGEEPEAPATSENLSKKARLAASRASVEGDRAYYLKLYPPDFVNGLFAGGTKYALAALQTIEKLQCSNDKLLSERSKTIQAMRIDKVIDQMISKGMIRSAEDIMREDQISIELAVKKAQLELNDRKAQLLDMDEESFDQFVEAIAKVKDRPMDNIKTASTKQGVRIPPMLKTAELITSLADADASADSGSTDLWSTPPSIEETVGATKSITDKLRHAAKIEKEKASVFIDDSSSSGDIPDFMKSIFAADDTKDDKLPTEEIDGLLADDTEDDKLPTEEIDGLLADDTEDDNEALAIPFLEPEVEDEESELEDEKSESEDEKSESEDEKSELEDEETEGLWGGY